VACSYKGTCLEKTNVFELADSDGTHRRISHEKIHDIKAWIFECSCRAHFLPIVVSVRPEIAPQNVPEVPFFFNLKEENW
jgi:hypothetical protein